MSRIGRKTVSVPEGVEIGFSDGRIEVKGPLGVLRKTLPRDLSVKRTEGGLSVSIESHSRKNTALWGLYRNLIDNMVRGVKEGFRRELELSGIGFKVKKEGAGLVFSLGFSHPVRYEPSEGISFEVREDTKLIVFGPDKSLVGEEASRIKSLKRPEPYKGKGIKYKGEIIRRKAGKVGKVGAGLGAK